MAEKILTLMSSDNQKFQIAETVAAQSKFLSGMIEDDCHHAVIPIPTANADTLVKVIQYCNRHSGRFSSAPSASVRPSSSSAASSSTPSTSTSVPRPNLVDLPSSSSASSSSFPSTSASAPVILDELSSLTVSDDDDDLKSFDEQFVKVDWNTLIKIIVVAHHLHIESLFHLCCKAAAEFIKDLPVDKVREHFKIENDFTPEEEEELRRQNAWAFEEE